jgi:uncharacterized membrane protein YtjA (UPF0391 family)
MIGWAVTCLIIALIAAALGFSGIVGTAVNLAWISRDSGIVIAIVVAIFGKRPPT